LASEVNLGAQLLRGNAGSANNVAPNADTGDAVLGNSKNLAQIWCN